MSEKVTKKAENEQPEEKKPVAKARVKETKKEEEKVGFFKKVGHWFKSNWKYIAVGAGGAVAGGAATYGVGKLGEHVANKRAAKNVEAETQNYD